MLRDAINQLARKPEVVELPTTCIEFLREHQIPEDIIHDLAACASPNWICMGTISLVPILDIIAQNTESIHACIDHGYLALAGGADGSPIVVDRSDRRMCYVEFPKLLSETWGEFTECIHPTPYLYDNFWNALTSDPNFPWDFYEAQRRWPAD